MSAESVFAGGSLLFSKDTAGQGNDTDPHTKIGLVTSINGPTADVDLLDTTTQDTTGGYRTFIPGLKNPGSLEFGLNLESTGSDAGQTRLRDDMIAVPSVNRRYQLQLTNTENWGFQAYVTQYSGSVPVDEILTASVTLSITGPVAFDESQPT